MKNVKQQIKGLYKLFFIILFLNHTSTLMCVNKQNFREKISPEIEKIEALPRKPKAELNIEVTKIKSELLEDIHYSSKEKALYVDFSKYYQNKNLKNIENDYKIHVSAKIDNTKDYYSYKTILKNNKKIIKIENFDKNLEKILYISVFDKNSNKLVKVFKIDTGGKIIDFDNIEIREAHIVYTKYSNETPNTTEEINFTLNGQSDKDYIDVHALSGFINAVPSSEDGTKIIAVMNRAGLEGKNLVIERERNKNSNETLEFKFDIPNTSDINTELKIKYMPNGSLGLQLINGNRSPYIIDIIHQDSNQNIIKVHHLNIYSKVDIQKPKFSYSVKKYDVKIENITSSSVALKAATIKVETDFSYAGYFGEKLFPIISLNELDRISTAHYREINKDNGYMYEGDYLIDGGTGTTGGKFPITIQKDEYGNSKDTGSYAYLEEVTKREFGFSYVGYGYFGKYLKSTTTNYYEAIMVGRYQPTSSTGSGPKWSEKVAADLMIKFSDADLKYIKEKNITNIKFETPYNKSKKIFLFSGVEKLMTSTNQVAGVAPDYKQTKPSDKTYIEIRNAFPYEIYYKEIVKRGNWELKIDSKYIPSKDAPIVINEVGPKATDLLEVGKLSGEIPKKPLATERVEIVCNNETKLITTTPSDFILEKRNEITVNLDSNGNILIKPKYWNVSTQDEFKLRYVNKSTGKTVGEYTFNLYPPNYFIFGNGNLDFGDILKGAEKSANTIIEVDYVVAGKTPELSLKLPVESSKNNLLYLKHEEDETKTILVKELGLGDFKVEDLKKKMYIPLSGKVQTTKSSEIGNYSNQIEILIHLK